MKTPFWEASRCPRFVADEALARFVSAASRIDVAGNLDSTRRGRRIARRRRSGGQGVLASPCRSRAAPSEPQSRAAFRHSTRRGAIDTMSWRAVDFVLLRIGITAGIARTKNITERAYLRVSAAGIDIEGARLIGAQSIAKAYLQPNEHGASTVRCVDQTGALCFEAEVADAAEGIASSARSAAMPAAIATDKKSCPGQGPNSAARRWRYSPSS